MPYVTTEQITRAKLMDLLTYLQIHEPYELVRVSGNVYTTRSHDSLKISNGKWCWWSRGIGGRSALDYLIKVKGMPLPDAVLQINKQATITSPAETNAESKRLILPERNINNDRVIAYLIRRGIHPDIINYCIRTNRLYESKDYHNAVFIGFDRNGVPKYAALRGISGTRYMGEAIGSDKRFSFSIPASEICRRVHLFESAVDLLSYATLELLSGRDWRRENYLSLAGIYKPKSDISESTLPAALMQYLKDHPEITGISLHLDNDTSGRLAAKTIQAILPSEYTVSNEPPEHGKDYNDYLKIKLGLQRQKDIVCLV